MHNNEQISNHRAGKAPRHAHQEIADLMAAALLRLRERFTGRLENSPISNESDVGLGFWGQKSVNANPDHQ
jgi:hypothetical protein